MKRKNTSLLAVIVGLLFAVPAQAQFGQNNVIYEGEEVLFYQSEHADFYHWQDMEDEKQIKNLAHVVEQVELSYAYLSNYLGHSLSQRPNVVFYRTHSTFARTYILGGHGIPEGVLAFALPTSPFFKPVRYVLAIKMDLSAEEYDSTITHEMAHIFQFDMGPNILKLLTGGGPPHWIMEGGAEYLANEYNSMRTDDLRESERRGAGANPEKDMPTWLDLNQETADPYTFGPMTLRFIKEKYGQDVVKKFLIRAFQDGEDLIEVLAELTSGAVRSPEQFDETQRDYWREKFGPKMFAKPRPYQEDEYFRGRHVVPAMYRPVNRMGYPEPVISAVVSPDGTKLAVLTPSEKYARVVLAIIPALPRDIHPYTPKQKDERDEWKIEILTPYLPPKHFEYIALGIDVPNLSWVKSGDKEYIAFFAQNGRDHILFIVDPNNKDDLRSVPVPLDNALSPALSPDATKAYFSASRDITRDIYELELATGNARNLTDDDSYDESPAVSPDGTKVAYISFWGSYRKIFLLNIATGEKKQLTFNAFNDQTPSWSDDGRTIVYTSDKKDGVRSIYTIDLETNAVSQLTDFFGVSFTPRFARGENDRVYYAHLWQYDQYRNFIGQNFELFEVLTKKPYQQYVMENKREDNSLTFIPNRDLFRFEIDENQLLNPTPAPEKWSCGGGGVQLGYSTYWGMVGQSFFGCSNLLQTKQHIAQFFSWGSTKVVNYFYGNQEKRTTWLWGADYVQMPLSYQSYDIVHRYPNQFVLNQTWAKEVSFNLSTARPWNRFERLELYSRLRHRSYNVGGLKPTDSEEFIRFFTGDFTADDKVLTDFFNNSTGSNLVFGTAYVRDTVLYSGNTWGPFHGNALRTQVEFAPPLGEEFQGYTSVNVAARMYRHLGTSSVFKVRGDVKATNRANGDFMLLGGPEYGRGAEYGSIVGNQVAYGSVEIGFPIPGTYLLGTPVRGFLYDDMAVAKFSDERFPAQKFNIPGIGVQFFIPFVGLPAQMTWRLEDSKLKPTFYVAMPW